MHTIQFIKWNCTASSLINIIQHTKKNTYLRLICPFFATNLTKCTKHTISLLHLEKKNVVCPWKRTWMCELGKRADHRHPSKPSLYCIQTKSPNVQCHKVSKYNGMQHLWMSLNSHTNCSKEPAGMGKQC